MIKEIMRKEIVGKENIVGGILQSTTKNKL